MAELLPLCCYPYLDIRRTQKKIEISISPEATKQRQVKINPFIIPAFLTPRTGKHFL